MKRRKPTRAPKTLTIRLNSSLVINMLHDDAWKNNISCHEAARRRLERSLFEKRLEHYIKHLVDQYITEKISDVVSDSVADAVATGMQTVELKH